MDKQLFCDKCHNFLESRETADTKELVQVCDDCGTVIKFPKDKPIEMYSESHEELKEFRVNTRTIPDLAQDITMPRIQEKCRNPNCGNDILVFKRGARDMSRMIICPRCNEVWIEKT